MSWIWIILINRTITGEPKSSGEQKHVHYRLGVMWAGVDASTMHHPFLWNFFSEIGSGYADYR